MRKGVDIDICDIIEMSFLLKVCFNGKEIIVKCLLNNGVDINDCVI